MPDYSVEIAALEAILNAGVETTSVDGLSVRYDFEEIRKRLQELKAMDDGTTNKRRLFTTMKTPRPG